jgi:membrane-bound inhibitor of C-type lysozyme
LLLFSSTREIRGFYIHKQVYYVVARNVDRAVGVAYDGHHIYWTDLVSGEEAIIRSKEDGSDVEAVVNAGMLTLQSCYC